MRMKTNLVLPFLFLFLWLIDRTKGYEVYDERSLRAISAGGRPSSSSTPEPITPSIPNTPIPIPATAAPITNPSIPCSSSINSFSATLSLRISTDTTALTINEIDRVQRALLDEYNSLSTSLCDPLFRIITSVSLDLINGVYQASMQGACRGCSPNVLLFNPSSRRMATISSPLTTDETRDGDSTTATTCVCTSNTPLFRAPTIAEINAKISQLLVTSNIDNIRQIEILGQSTSVDCTTDITNFSTDVIVVHSGNPDAVSASERQSLEQTFFDIYNDLNTESALAENQCDSLARQISSVEIVLDNSAFIGPFPDATLLPPRFAYRYRITGTCQGCELTSDLFGGSENQNESSTCICPQSTTTYRTPTKSEMLSAFDNALRNQLILTNVASVSRIDEADPIQCASSLDSFTSNIFIDVGASSITPTELTILSETFQDLYNEIASGLCDPFLKRASFVSVSVDSEVFPTVWRLRVAVTGLCRGCNSDQSLLSNTCTGVAPSTSLNGSARRLMAEEQSFPTKKRSLQDGEASHTCYCASSSPSRQPCVTEVEAGFEQRVRLLRDIGFLINIGSVVNTIFEERMGDPPILTPTPTINTPPPTNTPTRQPTPISTPQPTPIPTHQPTPNPNLGPTPEPTPVPSPRPTPDPTPGPTPRPTPPTVPPTPGPTFEPTPDPTPFPTPLTLPPTAEPTFEPTPEPTPFPTPPPTAEPTSEPTNFPSVTPTAAPPPTANPTDDPTAFPSTSPPSTSRPTLSITPTISEKPTDWPTNDPTSNPTPSPSSPPTGNPTTDPTSFPTPAPSPAPSASPTTKSSAWPTSIPSSNVPSRGPTEGPTDFPTPKGSLEPSAMPSESPEPSPEPSNVPSKSAVPTLAPTSAPSKSFVPTSPSNSPSISSRPTESPQPSPSPSDVPTTAFPTFTFAPTGPSQQPSISPSTSFPTVTHSPTRSLVPSLWPTESPYPTPAPSEGPSFPAPSPFPSEPPTISPTDSPAPSASPTILMVPTESPAPSPAPTGPSPTESPAPSPSPSTVERPSTSPSTFPPTESPEPSPSPSELPSS